MGYDITETFKACVKAIQNQDENKTVDRSILRPILRPSEFAKAALQVNRQIQQCKEFMESHRNKLTIPEVATIKERDAIETEIVTFIKTCSASVENLSKTIVSLKERPVQMTQLNPQAIAYRHGMVLISSEKLQQLTLLLDKYRSEYAIHIKNLSIRRRKQQIKQEIRLKSLFKSSDTVMPSSSRNGSSEILEMDSGQQMIQEESQALYDELMHLSDRVHDTERMMHEIATLNQMLSSQIMNQAEQIEQIYTDAVQASYNMVTGNRHLTKAAEYSRSSRRYILVLMICASIILLFLDRFYS